MVSLVSGAGGSAALERGVDWTSRLADVELGMVFSCLTLRQNLVMRGVSRRFCYLNFSDSCVKIHERVPMDVVLRSQGYFVRILYAARDAGLPINNIVLYHTAASWPQLSWGVLPFFDSFFDFLRIAIALGIPPGNIDLKGFPCKDLVLLRMLLKICPALRTSEGLTSFDYNFGIHLESGLEDLRARVREGIQITALDLRGASRWMYVSVSQVQEFLAVGLNSKLSILNLTRCSLDDSCLEVIGETAPKLTSLSLGGDPPKDTSTVTEQSLITLFSDLSDLRSLAVNGSDIPMTQGVLHSVARSCHELEELTLYGKALSEDGIYSVLEGCFSLRELTLYHCKNISKDTIEAWNRIRPTLKVVRA